LFADFGVAFETGIDKDRCTFADMAILAPFSIGLVQDIPDQVLTVAAMRIMTGAAGAKFGREIRMFLLYRSQCMTTQAKRLNFLCQKIGIWCLMGLMTGVALSLGIGCMGIFELLWQPGVAGEADFRRAVVEQPGLVRGVRIMATQTFALLNRFMYHPLALFFGRFSMAGIAQVFYLLLEQTFELGNMGTVAGKTLSFGCRVMIYTFLKISTLMT